MASVTAHNDYAQSRVPQEARYSWLSVATQRFGEMSCFSQFLLGATLGFSQTFGRAFLSITLGAVILEIVAVLLGIIGQREGLSTSMLARWTGFGRGGSAIIGVAIGISLVGWFGVQSGVAAQGLNSLIPALPVWAWSLLAGLAVTAVVVFGFHSMAWAAYLTVPVFMLLVAWSIGSEMRKHSLHQMISSAPAGPHLGLIAGTTLVAGGFIVGAIVSPDMTRYNRSVRDVFKQTIVSITLGEYLIGLVGVVLAHAVRSANITEIVTSRVGWAGLLIIILGTVKINDWNLYSSGLGVVNFAGSVFNARVNRGVTTLVIGLLGSALAAANILGHFISFLSFLGVAFPPIAGIMIAEYFIVKTWRSDLEESHALGRVPVDAPQWVPATLVIWVVATLIGKYVTVGLPSINSLLVGFLGYVVLGKLGLIRGYGAGRTETFDADDAARAAGTAVA